MTAIELRYLESRLKSLRRRRLSFAERALLSSFVICAALGGLSMLAARAVNPKVIVGFSVLLGVLLGVWIILKETIRITKRLRQYEQAVAQGVAHEFRILSSRMLEFEEIEDEGVCYAFELSTGGVVFITGQDFYASAKFPNDDFSIVEFRDLSDNLVDFQIEKRGDKLLPLKHIPASEKKRLAIPEHLTLMPTNLDSIVESLKVNLPVTSSRS